MLWLKLCSKTLAQVMKQYFGSSYVAMLWLKLCSNTLAQVMKQYFGSSYVAMLWLKLCSNTLAQVMKQYFGSSYVVMLWLKLCSNTLAQVNRRMKYAKSGALGALDFGFTIYVHTAGRERGASQNVPNDLLAQMVAALQQMSENLQHLNRSVAPGPSLHTLVQQGQAEYRGLDKSCRRNPSPFQVGFTLNAANEWVQGMECTNMKADGVATSESIPHKDFGPQRNFVHGIGKDKMYREERKHYFPRVGTQSCISYGPRTHANTGGSRSYLAPRTFWTLQVDDVCKSEDYSYHKKNKTPLCVCEYKMWVEFLHEILFPHFFHPTLNTKESRTTFRAIVYEIQLYGHLHPINPEIDRTYHRLVRQSRNLPFHSVPDSDFISNSIPVSVHSVQYTDFVHSVALSDSEHSENSVYSENMAQPPTPPGPRERTLRELAECKGLSVGVIFGTKDILDITNSYHKKNKTPLCVCEYKYGLDQRPQSIGRVVTMYGAEASESDSLIRCGMGNGCFHCKEFEHNKRYCSKLDPRPNATPAEEARDHGQMVTLSGAGTSGVDDPARGKRMVTVLTRLWRLGICARSLTMLVVWGQCRSWKPRLIERLSPERERITWEGEILDYTGGFSPERELSRLGEKWQFWAVDTRREERRAFQEQGALGLILELEKSDSISRMERVVG
ncbi:hypothetical protein Lal_00042938 [Lupinus albus]|nr:hypothetical protein Lal_00042938 [Lupinus albus]